MDAGNQLFALQASGVYLDEYTDIELPCYEPAYTSLPLHGHSDTAGNLNALPKIELVRALKAIDRGQFSVYSESESELYVRDVDVVYAHKTKNPLVPSADVGIAPLFQSVYHDFQIVSTVFHLNVPRKVLAESTGSLVFVDNPVLTSSSLRSARGLVASSLYFGHAPFAGSVLSSWGSLQGATIASKTDSASPFYCAPYVPYIEQASEYMSVLRHASVRQYVVFGERIRDPLTTSPVVLVDPVPGFHLTPLIVPGPGQPPPNELQQPIVYVAAFRNVTGSSVGLLFLNWTDATEDLSIGVPSSPISMNFYLSAAHHGLSAGPHSAVEVLPDGSQVNFGTVTVGSGSALVPNPITLGAIRDPNAPSIRFIIVN